MNKENLVDVIIVVAVIVFLISGLIFTIVKIIGSPRIQEEELNASINQDDFRLENTTSLLKLSYNSSLLIRTIPNIMIDCRFINASNNFSITLIQENNESVMDVLELCEATK